MDSLSDEERKKRAEEERRRAFLSSRDYARWSKLERIQQARFKRSIEDNKALFDFLRMVLTTSLLLGLVAFVFKSAPMNTEGEAIFPVLVIPLIALALIALVATWNAGTRFLALMVTQFAISNLWAFKTRRGSTTVSLYVSIWAIQLFYSVSIIYLAWLIADQASLREVRELPVHVAPLESNK
jgi:hypothetical protein